jgi:hypothetical protein
MPAACRVTGASFVVTLVFKNKCNMLLTCCYTFFFVTRTPSGHIICVTFVNPIYRLAVDVCGDTGLCFVCGEHAK